MISYEPLFRTLIARDMESKELLKIMSYHTYICISQNKITTLKTINNICRFLDCKIQDVIEYVDEK